MAQELSLKLPEGYELSDGEVDNIVYLTCKYTIGWGMRACDKAVCDMMRDKKARGQEAVENLLEVATEYVWDHICGEPEEPSQEQLFDAMVPLLNEWFSKTTPEERAKTT